METKSIKERLYEWGAKYTQKFNELSESCNTKYYTQSPLNVIEDEVEVMVVGINPYGETNQGSKKFTTEGFLEGNDAWNSRFTDPRWGKYWGNARVFLGLSTYKRDCVIDDDKKTIWTNITPFQSKSGFNDLPKEVIPESINAFFELIEITKPKRIILLSVEAFKVLDRYAPAHIKEKIEYVKVLDNVNLQIGRIFDIPTVCVNHPSGQWAVSHSFISVFVFLYFLTDRVINGKLQLTLSEVRKRMRDDMKLWLERIEINDNND